MIIAVLYYSKAGTAEKIATKIQAKTGAVLYFAEPDKSYGGSLSAAASVAGEKLRKDPAKPKTVPAMSPLSAFPVWYSTMPRFMRTYADARLNGIAF